MERSRLVAPLSRPVFHLYHAAWRGLWHLSLSFFRRRAARVCAGHDEWNRFARRLFWAWCRCDCHRPCPGRRRERAARAWQGSRTLTNRTIDGSSPCFRETPSPWRKPRQHPLETASSFAHYRDGLTSPRGTISTQRDRHDKEAFVPVGHRSGTERLRHGGRL